MRFLFLCLLITILSCQNQTNTLKNTSFILPINGCPGCFKKVVSFCQESPQSREFDYFITGYTSDKDMRLRIERDWTCSETYHLDYKNRLLRIKPEISEIYPTIIYINQQGLLNSVTLNSKNIDRILDSLSKGHSLN